MSFEKRIFTFVDFEQKEKIPAYINLCLKSWKKYAPKGYEIVILNKHNFLNYIPKDLLPGHSVNTEKYSFPHFFDYVSALVLYENGGIFMDADTVMTERFSDSEPLLEGSGTVVFGISSYNICPGFIKAERHSPFVEELMRRYVFKTYLSIETESKRNFIINDVLRYCDDTNVTILDCEKNGYYMEKAMYGIFDSYIYNQYYFENYSPVEDFLKTTKGLTALHNSFSPLKYKKMDEKKFLKQEILLSKIFKVIL